MKKQIFFLLFFFSFTLFQRWIRNVWIFKSRNNLACIAGLLLILTSCLNKYSKREHVATIPIGPHLFNEIYKVYSGGVFASDSYSNYITDSVNFRKYVGTRYYDDEEIYCHLIDSNIVLVVKLSKDNTKDTIDKEYYNTLDLIANGEFE